MALIERLPDVEGVIVSIERCVDIVWIARQGQDLAPPTDAP